MAADEEKLRMLEEALRRLGNLEELSRTITTLERLGGLVELTTKLEQLEADVAYVRQRLDGHDEERNRQGLPLITYEDVRQKVSQFDDMLTAARQMAEALGNLKRAGGFW